MAAPLESAFKGWKDGRKTILGPMWSFPKNENSFSLVIIEILSIRLKQKKEILDRQNDIEIKNGKSRCCHIKHIQTHMAK